MPRLDASQCAEHSDCAKKVAEAISRSFPPVLFSLAYFQEEAMLLEGRVAIVTGAGRGIGRAIARKFAAEGAPVVVAARTEKEVMAVDAEIRAAGGKAAYIAADVSQATECERIVKTANDAFGGVQILVNNAGIYGPVRPAEQISQAEWDEVMAINLRGAFLLSALVLPQMYALKSGVILNVTSAAAKAAFPLNSAYAASKAGLMGLTRTLAAEGARKGVRVNAISPGPVPDTKMSEELRNELGRISHSDSRAIAEQMARGTLQGRPQTPDEIASAALFLASDHARAITGQTLNVDGGIAFY
jgi:NAD(P)-dependent dehydrogenase (short-subunit alcohol dehydrogenase family)